MKTWIVYFVSANYCGYGEYCLVKAETENEARKYANGYAEDLYYEQDCDQWHEEHGEDTPVAWAYIKTIEILDESHECWMFVQDPKQAIFYPMVN